MFAAPYCICSAGHFAKYMEARLFSVRKHCLFPLFLNKKSLFWPTMGNLPLFYFHCKYVGITEFGRILYIKKVGSFITNSYSKKGLSQTSWYCMMQGKSFSVVAPRGAAGDLSPKFQKLAKIVKEKWHKISWVSLD